MKFSRVIGEIDPALVAKAEDKLSKTFLDLGLKYDNKITGTQWGGDPFIFSLIVPIEHVCTLNIPTAATDGKRYYWNPKFILKNSIKGLRVVCSHEAWHAIYMHPQRRGSRIPKLWNIAVDYIVNGTIMDDFKTRGFDPVKTFSDNLGQFLTLDKYAEFIKDPFKSSLDPLSNRKNSDMKLPKANENRELSSEEIKELEKREKIVPYYYADPNLSEDMKRPEVIYDYLLKLLPKCPSCGKVGMYKLPKKSDSSDSKSGKDSQDSNDQNKDSQDNDQNKKDNGSHTHGNNGNPCNCPHQCNECGDGFDIFDFGDTVDDHMDADESEEKMAKRIASAAEAAKKFAGSVPGALEEELGKLTEPKITWQDVIRARIKKARDGNGRNDWTRFRSRPLFSGQLIPKRRNYTAKFGCLVDTSGSMSSEDIAFGLSQLISLDEKSEGIVTCADAQIYWDKSTKITKANVEELSKIKIVGRGGTLFANYFAEYEKQIGECDFLIIITDGYLMDTDIAEMQNPGIETVWLITSSAIFKPPFGKCYQIRNM